MPKLQDRVQETTTSTGTGSFTLNGAVTGYITFNAGFTNGDVVWYVCDDGAGNWEIGYGTVGTGTLSRTVFQSSNANALVPFGVGNKRIFCTAPYTYLLPDMSGNSGKFLTTNGTVASWADSGTVTSVSVVSANGFAGTSSGGATPALTLSTTVTGMLKGNGTALTAATAGTDYLAPPSGTAILKANSGGALANAVSGTDYAPATSGTSILKGNGSGGFTAAVANTDFQGVISATGLLKGAGAGSISAAVVGTDYAPATSGTAILKGNGAGGFSSAAAGTDYAGLASANTFTNNQVISVSSASDALRITQTGSGNAILVEDNANPDSTPFVVDASGNVVAGTTSAITAGGSFVPLVQSHMASQNGGFFGASWLNNSGGPNLILGKSRGAVGTQTIVQSGDTVGNLRFQGSDGTAFIELGQIAAQVDGTPGTNDMPGRLVFSTTADGASSPTERMRIDSAGRVGIGATPGTTVLLTLSGTPTSANTNLAIARANPTFSSAITGTGVGFDTNLSTQAASFTLSELNHFRAILSSIGAGSTVTNQYGFTADSSLTGATNNYGFYSNIASGTGRWNFYAAGSASNYFAGNTTIAGDATLATVKSATITTANSNTVEATSGPTSSQLAGNRNKIINGAMMIDQRNAGASVTAVDNGYTLDRWRTFSGAASKFTVQQQTSVAPVGFSHAIKITSSSSYTPGSGEAFCVNQPIEGLNCADLNWGGANAASVTLSFKVYSSLTGAFSGSLFNSAWNRSYPFTYSVSSANTWTTISVTIPGDTSGTWLTTNGTGLVVNFDIGSGANWKGTANAWGAAAYTGTSGSVSIVGTSGATWYVAGVQLEKGATATPFENRLYGTELALCQRYYWAGGNGWAGIFNSPSTARFSGGYPVQMRTAPTVSAIAAPTALNPSVSESQTGSQTTGFSAPASGGSIDALASSKIQFGGFSSGADGRPSVLTNSPLSFSAEL